MVTDTIKKFKEQISNLKDDYDIQSAEIKLLQNEITDDRRPAVISTELTSILSDMMYEYFNFAKGKVVTDKMQKSKDRVFKALELGYELSSLATKLNTLKLINRQYFSDIQRLRIENHELKTKLNHIQQAHEEL